MYGACLLCQRAHRRGADLALDAAAVCVDAEAVVFCAFRVVAVSSFVCVAVDVGLWPSPPRRCDKRRNGFLSVEIAHLLAPQCLVGFLPRASVRPVVLVDDYWYWFAWLVACSLRNGSRRRQPSDDIRIVLPYLLLDRKEKHLYV